MHIKAFMLGAAVASLVWLAVPAALERPAAGAAAPAAAEAVDWRPAGAPHAMSHAELMRRWQAMTPEQREAHRQMARCPYSSRAGQGAPGRAPAGQQGLRPTQEPLGT